MTSSREQAGKLGGNVAIVTGAAQGLGLATARRLVDDGAHVVFADIQECDPQGFAELGPRAMAMRCDVSDSEGVDLLVATVLQQFGRLDIMVANAGIGRGALIVNMADELFRQVLSVNLEGSFYCCRAAARAMIPARSGVILTVGSTFGRDTPVGNAAYGASKAGVMAMTAALARELGPHGIRVNCVSPGNMATEMHWSALHRRAGREDVSFETLVNRLRSDIPLGRHGKPEDIAALVSFLVSPDASYISGQTINVDGGYQPR
ncbi:MAG TPA: SDR family NAD(P)-dependent oxidoreductase [Thermomicrobiales bacterium]|nr:SDR family NAD(P)-dependent oxidoreductase [Thermomicrobiales bacterium]